MRKPKIRSKAVDAAIKMALAKLAQKQFETAMQSIGGLSDDTAVREGEIPECSRRMEVIESYLEMAGAEATRFYFKG